MNTKPRANDNENDAENRIKQRRNDMETEPDETKFKPNTKTRRNRKSPKRTLFPPSSPVHHRIPVVLLAPNEDEGLELVLRSERDV